MALASLVSFQKQLKKQYCIRYAHALLKSTGINISLVDTR
jgi:hypothetical protein